jgi:sodium transport system permease protein
LGLVIGYIAVQTGSLLPCILFHLTHNALMFATLQLPELAERAHPLSALLRQPGPDQVVYTWPVVVVCGLAALLPLAWFQRLPYAASKEEQLSDARARQPRHPLMSGAD